MILYHIHPFRSSPSCVREDPDPEPFSEPEGAMRAVGQGSTKKVLARRHPGLLFTHRPVRPGYAG